MHVLRFLGEVNVGLPPGAAERCLSRPLSVSILAYLAAADRGGVTRDRLVALLWEHSDRSHARHSLSNQLHVLRKVLGSDGILTSGDFVRLNPEVVSADVTEFKRALCTENLRRAADLYSGPLLDGFHLDGSEAFGRWVDEERGALAARALEVFEALAEREMDAGEPAEAVRWLQRAHQSDPYNSRVALDLAHALAAIRDPGNGIQLLQDHSQKLRGDLGIEPDPRILDLIRTGDFGPTSRDSRASEARLSSPGGSADSSPFNTATPGPPGAESTEGGTGRATGGSGYRALRSAAAFLMVAILSVMTVILVSRARGGERYDPDLVAILPALPAGVDSAVTALVSSQLYAETSDWRSMRVGNRSDTDARWHRLGGSQGGDLPEDIDQRVASGLGAGRVLTSTVSPSIRGIQISAVLTSVPDGRTLAVAKASGAIEDVGTVVHWLLVQVIAKERGIPADRIATLVRQDPESVHLFVEAHPHDTETKDGLLREAIAGDSSFALAALELYESYEESKNDSDPTDPTAAATEAEWERVASIIWNNQDRLSPADRAYANARLGWRFDESYTARLAVDAWDQAVEVGPNRIQHWRQLFLNCYAWCSSFSRSWREPLLDVHAELMDRGDTSWVEIAMEVAVMDGDTARMRTYAEILPPDAWYGRWLAGIGLDREADRAVVLERMPELGNSPLMRIGNFAILTGLGIEDAERAAAEPKRGAAGSVYALRQAVLARERGRHAEYRRLRDKMFQIFDVNAGLDALAAANVIAEWAAFGEPETDETLDGLDRTLSRIVSRGLEGPPDTLAVAHCYRSWLRLERGDTTGVDESLRMLESTPSIRTRALARMCTPFLRLLIVRENGRETLAVAARNLHEAVRDRPITPGQRAGMFYTDLYISAAANLELARVFGELGYPETGFQVVARRPVQPWHWGLFGFHIEFVRTEAKLLAQAGETEAALDRYERYFRLRPVPPDLASWAEEWKVVRAEYEALKEPVSG